MNGTFESNSNNYDESNLNRLNSVVGRYLWRGLEASNEEVRFVARGGHSDRLPFGVTDALGGQCAPR